MRVAVDLQGTQTASRVRGIGRYVRALVHAMLDEPRDHEVVLLANGLLAPTVEALRAELDPRIAPDRIRLWFGPAPASYALADPRLRAAAASIRLAALDALAPDAILVPSVVEGFAEDAVVTIPGGGEPAPTAAVLHDLLPLEHPEEYLDGDARYRSFYEGALDELRRADLLLTNSLNSSAQAERHLDADPARVVHIGAAVDDRLGRALRPEAEVAARCAQLGVPRSYYLYVGGTDARKNLPRLLEAHASLPRALRKRTPLVLAGDIERSSLRHLRRHAWRSGLRSDDLVTVGHVTDDDLMCLYQGCQLFVFPSWSEGFGLPALEAMSGGAPVVASDIAAVREVVDLPEARFDPYSVPDIAAAVERGLTDTAFRTRLVEHGRERATAFSWAATAATTFDALEALVAGRPAPERRSHEQRIERLVVDVASRFPRTVGSEEFAETAVAVSYTLPPPRPRRVYVDISELAERDARTGIQRVVRSVLGEWLEHRGDEVVPVAANREDAGYRHVHGYPDDIVVGELIEPAAGDLFVGLDFQAHTVLYQEHYLRFLRDLGVRLSFVVYDLLPLSLPDAFADGYVEVHRAWLRLLGSFDGALCISEDVARNLLAFLDREGPARLLPLDVGWFPLGGDHGTHEPSVGMPDDAEAVLGTVRSRPTFLAVGTIEPRKGHDQLLDAFDELWRRGVDVGLVLVGKAGWKVEDLVGRIEGHAEAGGRLLWQRGISDEFLDHLYEEAAALVVPSRGEGFGLPLVEAARYGTAILARDLPVFREVAGDHASYFAATDAAGLADAVVAWLAARERGEAPDSTGLTWSTWAQAAEALWAVAVEGAAQAAWPAS